MRIRILIIAVLTFLFASCNEDEKEHNDLLVDKIWNITEPSSDSVTVMRNYSDQLLFCIEPYGKAKNCNYKKLGAKWKWIDGNSIEIYKLIDSTGYETIEEIHIVYIEVSELSIYFFDDEGQKREAKYNYSETSE